MISLADLQRRIERGELSPDDALAQSLAAIDAQEKTIGAFVHRAAQPRAQTSGVSSPTNVPARRPTWQRSNRFGGPVYWSAI